MLGGSKTVIEIEKYPRKLGFKDLLNPKRLLVAATLSTAILSQTPTVHADSAYGARVTEIHDDYIEAWSSADHKVGHWYVGWLQNKGFQFYVGQWLIVRVDDECRAYEVHETDQATGERYIEYEFVPGDKRDDQVIGANGQKKRKDD